MKKLTLICFLLIALACRKEAPLPDAAKNQESKAGSSDPAQSGGPSDSDDITVGSSLPAFEADSLNGGRFSLAELKGKPALINVWATWCGPCRVEIPELKAIDAQYRSRGLQVVGISIDTEEALEDVKGFVEEYAIGYRNILDPGGAGFASRFEASVIPISLLVDKNGKVSWIHYGVLERSNQEFQQQLEKALKS